MLTLRKILFYCFAAAYLICCPLLILYTLGITFKPDEPSLQKTGIIYLSTIPPDAKVFINNRPFSETTPTVIRNLDRGKYSVKIILPEHKPWVKTLPVEETKATSPGKILLIPQTWPVTPLSGQSFQGLVPFPGFPFFIIKNSGSPESFFVSRWKEGLRQDLIENENFLRNFELLPLFPEESGFSKAKVTNIHTVKGSHFSIVEAELREKKKYFRVDVSKKNENPEDITDLFVGPFESVVWNPESDHTIYVYREGAIDAVDLPDRAVQPNILKDILSFALYNNHIYALTKKYRLFQFDARGKNPKPLLKDPATGESLFKNKGGFPFFKNTQNWEIAVFSEDIIVFLSKTGALLSSKLPHRLIPQGVRGFQFNKINDRLLIWKSNDVGFVNFGKSPKNGPFEHGPEITWLQLPARNVRQAFWINKGEQIVYVDGDKIWVTDTRSFGQPQAHEIARIKKNSGVHYSDESGRLFYLTAQRGTLSTVEVVHQEAVLSLPQNEREETAGFKEEESAGKQR